MNRWPNLNVTPCIWVKSRRKRGNNKNEILYSEKAAEIESRIWSKWLFNLWYFQGRICTISSPLSSCYLLFVPHSDGCLWYHDFLHSVADPFLNKYSQLWHVFVVPKTAHNCPSNHVVDKFCISFIDFVWKPISIWRGFFLLV